MYGSHGLRVHVYSRARGQCAPPVTIATLPRRSGISNGRRERDMLCVQLAARISDSEPTRLVPRAKSSAGPAAQRTRRRAPPRYLGNSCFTVSSPRAAISNDRAIARVSGGRRAWRCEVFAAGLPLAYCGLSIAPLTTHRSLTRCTTRTGSLFPSNVRPSCHCCWRLMGRSASSQRTTARGVPSTPQPGVHNAHGTSALGQECQSKAFRAHTSRRW